MADIEQLDRALAWIRKHPRQHDQGVWIRKTWCGTTMCLAGVVTMLNGWMPYLPARDGRFWEKVYVEVRNADGDVRFVSECAADLLGLDWRQAHELFLASNTYDDLVQIRDNLARLQDSGREVYAK